MPIYVESRDLDALGGFVAEHQYLVYIPVGEELNYDAWLYIGAFPDNKVTPDGSLLSGNGTTNIFFENAIADRWTMGDFFSMNFDEVETVAAALGKDLLDVEVKDMVAAGYGGSAGSAAYVRQRELVSDGGEALWNFLVATANDISEQYTYNAEGFSGFSDVFGPSLNSNSFISSILRLAQDEGYDIGAFDTDANVVGNRTWLGTQGDDVLDGRIQFANGDAAQDLFGGGGADTLYAGTGDSYLVAGRDLDKDILIGSLNEGTELRLI